MAEEKAKGTTLKLRKESGEGLKSSVKKPAAETPERKERDGKEVARSVSFGRNLVKVGKEFAKSNVRGEDEKSPVKVAGKEGKGAVKEEVKSPIKVASKGGKASVKQEAKSPVKVASKGGKASVKQEAKSPVKVASKGKVSVKAEGNANGKDVGKVNRKEQGKSAGKVNGKDSPGVRGSVKAKEEDRDEKQAKGKSSIVKRSPVSTPVKPGSATKASAKSTKDVSSLRVKKVVQTTTTTTTTTVEAKKEKKVYSLPGQKHDPPEERDALRIFYSTLREQKPDSEMAEFWLMEYGLLPHDEAEKALERKQKLRGISSKSGTATKTCTPLRASNGSPSVKKSTPVSNGKGKGVGSSSKGKKKRDESDSDDDNLDKAVMKKKKKVESDSDDDFLEKAVTKKKPKAESDSDDDFLQEALPKKKLKK